VRCLDLDKDLGEASARTSTSVEAGKLLVKNSQPTP